MGRARRLELRTGGIIEDRGGLGEGSGFSVQDLALGVCEGECANLKPRYVLRYDDASPAREGTGQRTAGEDQKNAQHSPTQNRLSRSPAGLGQAPA